tara:strand:+ start:3920 stop:5524 length:1605 start_codon:yes stop_codon:yes gene_type:complete
MAININKLFADIISTPEQRQEKLLQQGMLEGQLLSSGLKGRVANLAPLAQIAGQLGVQRNEDLRRAVQPMMGIDPRTTGEKMQEQLGQMDVSTPAGLLQAANSIQSVDPIRAAALRQAASQMTMEIEDRESSTTLQKLQITAAEREAKQNEASDANRSTNAIRYTAMGVPSAFIKDYISGDLQATDMMKVWGEQLAANVRSSKAFKFVSLKGEDKDTAIVYIDDNDAAQELLKLRESTENSRSFFGFKPWRGDKIFDQQDLLDEAAVWRGLDDDLSVRQAIDKAIQSLPIGGARGIVDSANPSYGQQIQDSFDSVEGISTAVTGQTNINSSNAGAGGANDPGFQSQINDIFNQAEILRSEGAFPAQQTGTTPQPSLLNEGSSTGAAMYPAVEFINSLINSNQAQKLKEYSGDVGEAGVEMWDTLKQGAAKTFDDISAVISSTTSGDVAKYSGFTTLLDKTEQLVGTLVEGQATSRQQGEEISLSIKEARENIKELRAKLGDLPPITRREVNKQLTRLQNSVINQAARLAGTVFD